MFVQNVFENEYFHPYAFSRRLFKTGLTFEQSLRCMQISCNQTDRSTFLHVDITLRQSNTKVIGSPLIINPLPVLDEQLINCMSHNCTKIGIKYI